MSRKGRLQVSVFLNRVPLRYYCSNEAVGASRRTSERARRGSCRRAGRRFYRHREFPPRFIIRGTFALVFSVEIFIFIFSMTAHHVMVARRASLGERTSSVRVGDVCSAAGSLGPVHPAGCSRPRPRDEGHGRHDRRRILQVRIVRRVPVVACLRARLRARIPNPPIRSGGVPIRASLTPHTPPDPPGSSSRCASRTSPRTSSTVKMER